MHYVAIFTNITKFRYNVYEKLNNSCNFQKNWGEDDCKLDLVNIDDIILFIRACYFQLVKELTAKFNCTAPWLLKHTRLKQQTN